MIVKYQWDKIEVEREGCDSAEDFEFMQHTIHNALYMLRK